MKYLYRVVCRLRPEFWDVDKTEKDYPWQTYISSSNPAGRPYTNAQAVRGIVSSYNNADLKYEYKPQRFPLTQEWEDM